MKKQKKIPQAKLKEFARVNAWEFKMRNSGGFDSFDNYSGGSLGDLVVVAVGRNRDSDLMSESNFSTALDMLGGVSKNVSIERFGHWGCGWFELILVNPKHKKSLEIAYRIKESLDHYPLLDEDDFYSREAEEREEYAEMYCKDTALALAKHFGLKYSAKLKKIAYWLQLEDQYQNGNDSSINIYSSRAPEKRDIEQLKDAINSVSDNEYHKSKLLERLKTAVENYRIEEVEA